MSNNKKLSNFSTNTRSNYNKENIPVLPGLVTPRRPRESTAVSSVSTPGVPTPGLLPPPVEDDDVFVTPGIQKLITSILESPHPESPAWDHGYLGSTEDADVTVNWVDFNRQETESTQTVFYPTVHGGNIINMSMLDDFKYKLEEAESIYTEDFAYLDAASVASLAPTSLACKRKELIVLRTDLRVAINYIKRHDKQHYETIINSADQTRQGVINVLKLVESQLGENHKQDVAIETTELTPVDKFKMNKVEGNFSETIEMLDSLKLEYSKLLSRSVSNDVEFYAFEEEVRFKIKATDDIVKDAKQLENDALAVGKTKEALELTQRTTGVRNYILNIESKIYKHRNDLGLFGTSLSDKNISLELPNFGGKNGLDYFTFRARFDKYCSLVRMSAAKQLHLLKVDCILEEGLRLNLNRFTSVGEVFDFLERHYGDKEALLYEKRKEILSVGKFPWYERSRGNPQPTKQRDWLLQVDSKLRELRDLAEDHSIANNLYYSDLIYRVEAFFPEQLKDEFIDLVSQNPNKPNGKETYLQFLSFLSNLVARYTVKCNHYSATYHEDSAITIKKDFGDKAGNSKTSSMHTFNEPDEDEQEHNHSPSQKVRKKGNNNKVSNPNKTQNVETISPSSPSSISCPLECGKRHTHLFYCQQFTSVSDFKLRFNMCREHYVCMRCLRLDSNVDFKNREMWWENHQADCVTDYVCDAGYCKNRKIKSQTHMLNCFYHYQANKLRESEFKESLDKEQLSPGTSFFSLFCINTNYEEVDNTKIIQNAEPDITEPSIFMNHEITVCGKQLTVFYDSGAEAGAISDRGYTVVDCINVKPGPTVLSVAGGELIKIDGGDERFSLDLFGGGKASFTALKMNNITTQFPIWETSKVWDEIKEHHKSNFSNIELPSAPKTFGGKPVDVLLGIKYLKYYPKLLFSLPCGLSVYKSQLLCSDGNQLVLGGPHKAWRGAYDKSKSLASMMFFLTKEVRALRIEAQSLSNILCFDRKEEEVLDERADDLLQELIAEDDHECPPTCAAPHCVMATLTHAHNIKREEDTLVKVDSVGTEASYRCLRCRGCKECLKGDTVEIQSLQEEQEQAQIEAGVRFDKTNRKIFSSLPFIKDPVTHLTANKHIATKVYNSQKKLWTSNPEVKEDLLASHAKLESNGFVGKLSSLSPEVLEKINKSEGEPYYIPWRSVYKPKSMSSRCRIVFDGSSRTPQGESLNGCLAVGKNMLSSLYQILLRFRAKKVGVTCDVKLAYNNIGLEEEHYKYQFFVWQDGLEDDEPLTVWYIGTMIYGIKPSGTITIVGFRLLANAVKCENPEHTKGATCLELDSYMDDVVTGDDTLEGCEAIAEDIVYTLAKGSMSVKGFTYSTRPPHEEVSSDGESIGVLGYDWFCKDDEMKLDTREIFLAKIKRGKFPKPVKGDFRDALAVSFTKRTLLRVTASVYDPLGVYTPVMAGLKLDLHDIVRLQTSWDEVLPNSYLDKWADNLQIIEELRTVRFRRAVIPMNAVNTTPELLISCDASQHIAVCVVHARYKLKGGGYSCQMLTAKSKLVSTSTIPRAELKSARMAAAMGFICSKNLQPASVKYLSDSTIVLHWLNNDERPLHTAVRNATIEILRLTSRGDWYHIDGCLNIADLGTRVATVEQISPSSEWQNGPGWMSQDESRFPIKSFEEIKLSIEEKRLASQEVKGMKVADIHVQRSSVNHEKKVAERQEFSNYTPSPGRMSFTKLIRCRAAVVKYVTNLRKCSKKEMTKGTPDANLITFSDDELVDAANYYWMKATAEVRQFSPSKLYKDHSVEIDGILRYSGRVLDGQLVEDVEGLYSDLEPLCFVRPICDRYSPLSICIMKHCHEDLMHHAGGVATFQASRGIAYILQGRDLSDEILQNCPGCIRKKARKLEVHMGNIHSNRLAIIPAFYYCQIDIFGPLTAICEHNHRSTVKVYGLLFKCTSTTAVAAYCMQKYSTEAFISAFTRFGSRYAYPRRVTIDEGSQIVKGCKEMKIELHDFLKPMSTKFCTSIEFETAPVGHHSATGMAERAIKEVRKLFSTLYDGLKLDILQYETAFSYICSELNNLPIATLSRDSKDFDSIDLLTPNRLLLGRNNRRAPIGYPTINKPKRLLKQIESVKVKWWDVWRTEMLAEFIPGNSKWRTTKEQPKVGDIVIFLKTGAEAAIGSTVWKTGRVKELVISEDGLVRTVIIEYKNHNEKKFRTTHRSIRTIAILLTADQL